MASWLPPLLYWWLQRVVPAATTLHQPAFVCALRSAERKAQTKAGWCKVVAAGTTLWSHQYKSGGNQEATAQAGMFHALSSQEWQRVQGLGRQGLPGVYA